jgi:hypothetical protein
MIKSRTISDNVIPFSIIRAEGSIKDAEKLLIKKDFQISISEKDYTYIYGISDIILDFGKEICGGIRILISGANKINSKVRLTFGESLSETVSEYEASSSTNDHSPRDFETLISMLSDVEYGQTGFRFIRIRFLEENFCCQLKSVIAVFKHSSLKSKAKFSCSDELINKIYKTAEYTAFLCLQNDMVWDGIKRDRLVWIGDMHPESLALTNMFCECKNIENALTFSKIHSPENSWMNNIPSYSLWWIIVHYTYYMRTGKRAILEENIDYMKKIFCMLQKTVSNEGEIDFDKVEAFSDMKYYLDWSSYGKKGSDNGVKYLFIICLKCLKSIFIACNEDYKVIEVLLKKIKIDEYNGNLKQIIAFQALCGKEDYKKAAIKLSEKGAEGFSTFMSYYILKIMAEGEKTAEAINAIKQYYGGMLDIGATTFFEDFNLDWIKSCNKITEFPIKGKDDFHSDFGNFCYKGLRHSLCHGWSSGVNGFIVEYILGVKIIEAGCKKLKISPNLCGISWVKGQYPTPYGNVIINAEMKNGKLIKEIKKPEEIQIIE